MNGEGKTPPPSEVIITPPSEPPTNGREVGEPENAKQDSKGPWYMLGLVLPVVVLLVGNLFLSGVLYDFNRREEVLLQSDDDGVFRFSADTKTRHGQTELVSIIFLDPPLENSMAYRPEIFIGTTRNFQRGPYDQHCEVNSANAVCMYFLSDTGGGDLEFTKLGEYDKVNNTAEFVLSGEANESIGLRIDYYAEAAAHHYREVVQPRNQKFVFTIAPTAYVGALAFAAVTGRRPLAYGLLTSAGAMFVLGALYIVAVFFFAITLMGGA
jgi:hypothetical protein